MVPTGAGPCTPHYPSNKSKQAIPGLVPGLITIQVNKRNNRPCTTVVYNGSIGGTYTNKAFKGFLNNRTRAAMTSQCPGVEKMGLNLEKTAVFSGAEVLPGRGQTIVRVGLRSL